MRLSGDAILLALEGVHFEAAGEVEVQEALALGLELGDALLGGFLRRAETGEATVDLLGDEATDLRLALVGDEDAEVMRLDQPLQLVGRHVGLFATGPAEVAAETEEVAVPLPLDLHVGPARGARRAEKLPAQVVVVTALADGAALVPPKDGLHRLEQLRVDNRLVAALVLLAMPAHDARVELVGQKAMHL